MSRFTVLAAALLVALAGSGARGQQTPKAELLAVGTKWKGSLTVNNKSKQRATVTAVERGEKTAKLSISYENGAVWVFECAADGNLLKIKDVKRDKASDVNAGKPGLRPLGGTTGTVEVTGEKITLNYTVKAYLKEPALVCVVVAERQR